VRRLNESGSYYPLTEREQGTGEGKISDCVRRVQEDLELEDGDMVDVSVLQEATCVD
jgi:hypothetical protein